MKFLESLKNEILINDGAMGTMIMDKIPQGSCAEGLMLKNPEIILDVHKRYVDSGANVLDTNTFGATPYKLKKFGLDKYIKEINEKAVEIAKSVGRYVAGGIGPLGTYVEPIGEISFEDAIWNYKQQIQYLNDADFLLIETISDLRIAKAAIIAAKEVSKLPIFISFTFQDGRTTLGTDIVTFANVIGSMGVDGLGINCGGGPIEFLPLVKKLASSTNLPLMIYPNAGLPKIIDKKAVYDFDPVEFGRYAKEFVNAGANIVGSCCGSNPNFTREICNAVKGIKPLKRNYIYIPAASSRTKTVMVNRPRIIGERINPTGRKDIAEELRKNSLATIKKEALKQKQSGADFLDINTGLPDIDEEELLKKTVIDIQEIVDCPLVIDTTKPKALEQALRNCVGRPIINSVNASEDSMKTVFPLAKKYGALVIGLTLDHRKIPKTVEERVNFAKIIIKFGHDYIRKEDIFIDPLVSTISAEQDRALITLETLKELKKIGIKTNLGVSNVSHGLPNRNFINSAFLSIAIYNGLDLAIINPYEPNMMESYLSTIALLNNDTNCKKYIEILSKKMYSNQTTKKESTKDIHSSIVQAVIDGDSENLTELVKEELKTIEPLKVNDHLIQGLEIIGDMFNKKKIFLPQMLESAKTVKKAFELIKKKLPVKDTKPKGTIIFATVKGDIHDIGKNIVITILESNNFKVINLGVNTDYEKIEENIHKYHPDLICLSALMTTTVDEMEKIINRLKENKIDIPVMIGGAVVNETYANKIKTGYAKDAINALKHITKLIS